MDRIGVRNSSPVWTISPASLLSCTNDGLNGLDNPAFYQEEGGGAQCRKEGGDSYLAEDSEDTKEERTRRRRRCGGRVVLLVAAICVLMAVLLAMVAAVVYLAVGEVRTTWQNEAEYKEIEGLVFMVEGRLRITNRVFTADLLDPRSAAFTQLSAQISQSMDAVFLHSIQHYNETKVLGYRPGSVVAIVRVHLGRGRGDAPHHVGMAVVGALERHHGYLPGGRLQVDIRSLHFASLPDPDDNIPVVQAVEVSASSTTTTIDSITSHNSTAEEEDEAEEEAECHGDCVDGRVCLFLPPSSSPRCLEPRDPADPTGCGGWCLSEHQVCRRLGNATFQCADNVAASCDGSWRCGNGLCVAEDARCNGRIDCYDMTDEMDCECGSGHFKCGGGTPCLPDRMLCDGHVDCWDASDELNCTRGASCGEGLFTCNNGLCVHSNLFCDRFPDCSDGSDEPSGCGDSCNGSKQCGNGRCVERRLWCDGHDDCGDSSDEKDCDAKPT